MTKYCDKRNLKIRRAYEYIYEYIYIYLLLTPPTPPSSIYIHTHPCVCVCVCVCDCCFSISNRMSLEFERNVSGFYHLFFPHPVIFYATRFPTFQDYLQILPHTLKNKLLSMTRMCGAFFWLFFPLLFF